MTMLNQTVVDRVTGALQASGGLKYTTTLVADLPQEQYIDFVQQLDTMVSYNEPITQELVDRIYLVVNQTTYFDTDIAALLAD